MKNIKNTIVCFFALFSIFFAQKTNAQIEILQSTYIINFSHLIQWPGQEKQLSFRIGVFGKDHPIVPDLIKKTSEKQIGGKPIDIAEFESIEELTACHILFVPNNRLGQLRRITKALLGVPVLIVTETQEAIPGDSNINIYVEDDKLGYKLNQKKSEEKGLILSKQIIVNSR